MADYTSFFNSVTPSFGSMYTLAPMDGFSAYRSMSGYGMPVPAPVPAATVPVPSAAPMPVPAVVPVGAPEAPAALTPDPAESMTFGNRLKNTFYTEEGGFNLENIGSLAETIGAFGQLWAGIQANRVARETLDFQKRAFNTNLRNQTKSYNTALSDRATSRFIQNGDPSGADAYISANRLGGSGNKKKKTSLSSGISAFGKE